MGAQSSSLRSLVSSTGLVSSTEGLAYCTRRKQAAKELQAANKALLEAAAAYADALRGAGSSLVVFCAGTSLYAGTSLGGDASQAPSTSHAVPQSGPLTPSSYAPAFSGGPQTNASGTSVPPGAPPPQFAAQPGSDSAVSGGEEYPDGMPPKLGGEQEGRQATFLETQEGFSGSQEGLTDQDRAFVSANDFPLPPTQPSEAPGGPSSASQSSQQPDSMPRIPPVAAEQGPGSYPPGPGSFPRGAKPWESSEGTPQEHMSMQLSAPSGAPVVDGGTLNQYAGQLGDLFLEAAALTGPLIEALGAGIGLAKSSTPALSASSAWGLDGKLEPVGQTLQKLVNWERKLKEDVKTVDMYQHELRKKDKKLGKTMNKQMKKKSKDQTPQRVRDAQAGVDNVRARLASTTASLERTISELELFKSDLLLQQVLRLLPLLASLWQLSSDIFAKQQQLALQLSGQEPPQVTRSGSLSLAFRDTHVSGPLTPGPGPLTPVPEAYAASPDASSATLGAAGGGAGVPSSGPLSGSTGPARGGQPPLTRSQSSFARAIGVAFSGTTKKQHEATKKLLEAFKRMTSAKSALNKAQKGFCTSLMIWASKTKALPSSFPKPAPPALLAQPQLPPQLPLHQQQMQQQQQMQFPSQQQQQQQQQMQLPLQQQQIQMQQQQQMQLMVYKGDVYTALPNDWIHMLDTLPDGDLQGAISGFCGWLSQAYTLQQQEMKASKRVLEATRLLDKVEQKLAEKQKREHALRLALAQSGELLGAQEKEYHAKEQQLVAASNDVASAKAMVEAARDGDAKEKIRLERLIAGGKVAVATALQRRLAGVFEQASAYASTASNGFSTLQERHAPWMSGSASQPSMSASQAPPPAFAPHTNPAQAA